MVAAIKAHDVNSEASIVVLEKLSQPGSKVAASGNGRCNLSNIQSPEWEKTSAFFSSIGLFTRIDSEGRIYPYSEDGRDVVSILKKACENRGIIILTRREVTSIRSIYKTGEREEREEKSIKANEESFIVSTTFNKPKAYRPSGLTLKTINLSLEGIMEEDSFDVVSKKVLIATGGKSKPKMGTTGDGYGFARTLGHTINPLIPVLTGIEVVEFSDGEAGKNNKYRELAGIRQKCCLSLYSNNETIFQERGEIQFTDYGISGICTFDMTRFLKGKDFSNYLIEIDFVPDYAVADLEEMIYERSNSIRSIVKAPLANLIYSSLDLKEREKDNPENINRKLASALKHFILHPEKLRGWDMAQVTRGGVPLSEIDEETGESLLIPGLYFSGEMLDVDFRCGGFNLQHAWTSGIRAGKAMGESVYL